MLTIAAKRQFLCGRKFVDLFAGIGGFRLALSSFGGECVFSSDWDKAAQAVYEANFDEKPVGDITKIAATDVPSHDILCAGFPCQPFSVAGKQRGFLDTRGTLFFDIARIVAHHKPKLLLLENVKNLANHDKGRTLATIVGTLDKLGYDVKFKVLNAVNFGVPQARERVYIVGFLKELGVTNFEFPRLLEVKKVVADVLLSAKESSLKSLEISLPAKFVDEVVKRTERLGLVPKPVRIGEVGLGRQGERIYHTKGQAITLSAHGGGVGAKTGLYKVGNVVRRLHPRECARLTGFPDSFKLAASSAAAYKQFGNSVVVDVLQWILQSCERHLI